MRLFEFLTGLFFQMGCSSRLMKVQENSIQGLEVSILSCKRGLYKYHEFSGGLVEGV